MSVGLAKYQWYNKTKSKKIRPLKDIYYGASRTIDIDGDKISVRGVAELLNQKKVIAIFKVDQSVDQEHWVIDQYFMIQETQTEEIKLIS